MSNLLVEIGTEELPVTMLDVIYRELGAKAKVTFEEHRITHGQVFVEATPRRIALFLENVGARQADQNLEISGPSYEKAYDAQGKPTKALEGFLKSKGANLKDVQFKETPKGKFVLVRKKVTGKKTTTVLPEVLEAIFTTLSFPKNMRWTGSKIRFPRPIRWIVALVGAKPISWKFAGTKAAASSFGHRFLANKAVRIRSADWKLYQKALKTAHVVLDLEERKKKVRDYLKKSFHQKSFDEELVHITAQLVEEPHLVQGKFSKDYLDLPSEVLASCMKKNQKIFACYDGKGRLMNKFVAVLNGKRRGLPGIIAGYENVLDSRLKDARYFYRSDTQEPLEKKLSLLKQITYLGKLGTMREKIERLESFSEQFASLIGRDDLRKDLVRVSRLSKIDLMTQLVYEFPDLQGIVGREYAMESNEKEEVAQAMGTQYLPKSLNENYKDLKKELTPLGALFGIIDRLDLLVGAFGTGLAPSGSQDPYALRRAGGSVVKMIRAFRFHFSLMEAIELSIASYGDRLDISSEELTAKLLKFFEERVSFEIQVKPGSRESEILQAVFKASFDDLADVYTRYEILTGLYGRDTDSFLKTAKVVERTSNILKGMKGKKPGAIKPELFQEPLEKELFELCEERSSEISEWLTRRDYERATLLFGQTFYKTLDKFFEQVMVNVEDPAIQGNRQALMHRINRLYTERLADLSLLSRLE